MRKRIDFDDEDVEKALKKYFKIKGRITFWHIRSLMRNNHCVEYEEAK